MATDIVTLYNLALDKIGARATIALPTEQSREAEACNLWFPEIRDQVLASAFWQEATKMDRLALLSTQPGTDWVQGLPRPDYLNAYVFPSDCLRPQFLTDYEQFIIQSYGSDQKTLMTNSSDPVLSYTFRQTQISLWSPGLQMAIMYGLAASICESLTGKRARAKDLFDQANSYIISAREIAANTNDEQLDVLPDWLIARGVVTASRSRKFVFPLGSLLNVC